MNKYKINIFTFVYSIILLSAFFFLFYRFLYSGNAYLAFYEDDFFYYLKIAQNISQNCVSTFNGLNMTNGYHPLWMIIITFILTITKTSNFTFFIIFNTIIFGLTIFTLYQLKKFFSFSLKSNYLIWAFLCISIERYLALSKSGMEVALTIPFSILLVNYLLNIIKSSKIISYKEFFIIGILTSIVFLSRIDSAIFLLLVFISFSINFRNLLLINKKNALSFVIGLLPIGIYFFINLYYFGLFQPISGIAKSLRHSYHFTFNTIGSLLPPFNNLAFTNVFFNFILIIISCVLIFLIFYKKMWRVKIENKFLIYISFFFILHFLSLSFISGWILWYWYTYSLLLSFIFIISIVGNWLELRKVIEKVIIMKMILVFATMFILINTLTFTVMKKPSTYGVYNEATIVSKWIRNNPGIYAIGDRAGLVGYLSNAPIIQLEGITMDKEYINILRTENSLNKILKLYHVDYYISLNQLNNVNNTYTIYEPEIAKNAGNKYLVGIFKEKPIKVININLNNYYIFKLKN